MKKHTKNFYIIYFFIQFLLNQKCFRPILLYYIILYRIRDMISIIQYF